VINGLVYLGYSIGSRHLRRDLSPSRGQLSHIGREILNHLRFRFPKGEAAKQYNVLQKLTYLAVLILLAVMVLAGLTMSPQMDTAFPVLLHAFDGRQSARTIHFVIAFALLAFVLIHVFMVLVSGVWNNMRSMITGRYAIERQQRAEDSDVAS
jgi:thiosulfate reductase cytochrome b subunit